MKRTRVQSAAILAVMLAALCASAPAQLRKDQARRIIEAVPAKARVAPKKPRRVMIWNTPFMDQSPHKGYTIPQSEFAFSMLGKLTEAYEPFVSDDVAMYLPENLATIDAIVLNNANGEWIRPTENDLPKFKAYGSDLDALERMLRKSLLDWVSNGGGIVAFHHAIGGNNKWPEFLELLGAGYWGHPWNEEVGVRNEEPDHPLLAAFEGKDFRIADEIFQFREPYSRTKQRVLLSLDTAKTNMTVQWINRTDGDFALAWVKSHGRGRVFYSAIGHRTEIWWDPRILRFYLDGVQFACGDLEAPTTPR